MGEKPAKAPRGRPTRYNPKRGARIVQQVRVGVSLAAAAGSTGISRRQFFAWVAEGSKRVDELERQGLEVDLPDDLRDFAPPDLATFAEAIHRARDEAAALHEANFARHAKADWRASYAWLRHHRKDLYGDTGRAEALQRHDDETDEIQAEADMGQDLSGEVRAARARLRALRAVIEAGGTSALPLDRALALEAGAMATIARLVKAQHEVNPGAGKSGDFKILIELTEPAAALDLGPRVPDLEAGGRAPKLEAGELVDAPKPQVGDASGWDDVE